MDPIHRDALNIIRGEQNGDEFLYEAEYEDETGNVRVGIFRSEAKRLGLIAENDDGEP